ncbi:hypothetical protein FKP32DRAFT_1591411 [Trametes sanguinea]|nr:hypothetical protein FKP32DRAFT_1591411 [Trametes sanguinea]
MSSELAVQPPEVLSHAQDKPSSRPTSRSPMPGPPPISTIATTTSSGSSFSLSAPDVPASRSSSLSPSSSSSPSPNAAPDASSPAAKPDAPTTSSEGSNVATGAPLDPEPDEQILEALRSSKDRIYVLKLGEQMEALIKDRRVRIDLTPATSYQRLLVHRCSAYYKLSPETDPITKNIVVYCRADSRIPSRRICELVPVEESAQPAIQIMRRPRGRQHSQPGSTAGEDADTSDVDASEAGSIGSRSNAASAAAKRFKTIEEREAEYNEARSRIFMGFQEKEKEKEKDMSASSSTFSLVSGSGSTSGGRGSSIGDLDDSASSAPTESEWSGPITRGDKRDSRRGGGSTTSSRSLRSSGPSYTNGSGSSRNSRATSPSFTYPTLYEPASAPPYDQTQYNPQLPPPAGYVPHYGYPPYNAPPGQPYMGQYYYPPYGYPAPPQHSDPATPGSVEQVYHSPNPPQQPAYNPPYMWPNSPPPGQPPVPPHPVQHQHSQPAGAPSQPDMHPSAHPMPPMQNIPQYPPFQPPQPMYPYAIPGYYPQTYQPGAPMGPPPMPGHAYPPGPMPDSMHAGPGHVASPEAPNLSRTSSRNSNGHSSTVGKRGGPRTRGAWNYGPGMNMGNHAYNPPGPPPNGMGVNDAYGPRLNANMRRTSGTSSSSGSAGARTPADETSSTASSSTTSSSSRRTFTSTSTSSKHPLPARPDWAVGLKPQHTRHHDHHTNANSRTMSPARMGQPQPVLQPNDFPPLSSGPSTRQPVVGGAWTNASMSRVMMPAPQGANPQGTALVHYPNSQQNSPQIPSSTGRFDEQDSSSYERSLPKQGQGEPFNSKGGPRGVLPIGSKLDNGRSKVIGDGVVTDLSEKLGSVGLDEGQSNMNGVVAEAEPGPARGDPSPAGDAAPASSS